MISGNQTVTDTTQMQITAHAPAPWFALHTYPRHEKRVAVELQGKGVEVYLPLVSRRHQWSDRQKQVELPLFPGYPFARIDSALETRLKVLKVNGGLWLVVWRGRSVPNP